MRRGYFYSTVTLKCFIARLYLEKKKQPNFQPNFPYYIGVVSILPDVYLTENATTKSIYWGSQNKIICSY